MNHRGTETQRKHREHRNHEDTKSSQLTADHADRRRWSTGIQRVARSPPSSDDGRGPLGRVTVPKPSFCHGYPTQRPALEERRPRHCSFLRLEDLCPPSKHERGQAEPTRRRRGVREIARRRRTLASGVDVLSPGVRRSPDRRLFRRQPRYVRYVAAGSSSAYLRLSA